MAHGKMENEFAFGSRKKNGIVPMRLMWCLLSKQLPPRVQDIGVNTHNFLAQFLGKGGGTVTNIIGKSGSVPWSHPRFLWLLGNVNCYHPQFFLLKPQFSIVPMTANFDDFLKRLSKFMEANSICCVDATKWCRRKRALGIAP